MNQQVEKTQKGVKRKSKKYQNENYQIGSLSLRPYFIELSMIHE